MIIIKFLHIFTALLLGVGLVLVSVASPGSTLTHLIGLVCLILSIVGASIQFVLFFARLEEKLRRGRRVYQILEARLGIIVILLIPIMTLWLTLVVGFSGIYLGLIKIEPKSLVDDQGPIYKGDWHQDMTNCLYYSVITVTTLGYGDIKPASGKEGIVVKWTSMLEVALGIFLLTWFLSGVMATRSLNNT